MLLVTWNVNSPRTRLPRLLEPPAKRVSDVVCLQEAKTEPDAFPHAKLADRLTTCGTDRAFRKGPEPSDAPPSWSGCASDRGCRGRRGRSDLNLFARPRP